MATSLQRRTLVADMEHGRHGRGTRSSGRCRRPSNGAARSLPIIGQSRFHTVNCRCPGSNRRPPDPQSGALSKLSYTGVLAGGVPLPSNGHTPRREAIRRENRSLLTAAGRVKRGSIAARAPWRVAYRREQLSAISPQLLTGWRGPPSGVAPPPSAVFSQPRAAGPHLRPRTPGHTLLRRVTRPLAGHAVRAKYVRPDAIMGADRCPPGGSASSRATELAGMYAIRCPETQRRFDGCLPRHYAIFRYRHSHRHWAPHLHGRTSAAWRRFDEPDQATPRLRR